MSKQTRINQQLYDIPGTLFIPNGIQIKVNFGLIELEDLIDGFPGPKFSYGVLRFHDPLEPALESLLLAAGRLTIVGGGLQFDLSLYGLRSFTVINPIQRLNLSSDAVPIKVQRTAA
jgi:hypothetical protein